MKVTITISTINDGLRVENSASVELGDIFIARSRAMDPSPRKSDQEIICELVGRLFEELPSRKDRCVRTVEPNPKA